MAQARRSDPEQVSVDMESSKEMWMRQITITILEYSESDLL
jgi:hypothetical protein